MCHSERSEESSYCRGGVALPLYLCMTFLILICGSPLLAKDVDNLAKIEKEFIAQHSLYNKMQKEFDRHPVTKWRREIARNKKAIAILEKQLRDMVRFENEEQIEELRQENKKLQKQIDTKRKEWEALVKKRDAAKKQLESLKKQLGPARVEKILKDRTK
ncbi:MAG: coiled-coil domain-containing protein [Candidatus Brocadiales bacterium]